MKFRNYVPQAKELQDGKLAPPELPKFEDPIVALQPAVEKKVVCVTVFIFSLQGSPNATLFSIVVSFTCAS
jgi:hypothetical protein